jgi:hypothetical protein
MIKNHLVGEVVVGDHSVAVRGRAKANINPITRGRQIIITQNQLKSPLFLRKAWIQLIRVRPICLLHLLNP